MDGTAQHGEHALPYLTPREIEVACELADARLLTDNLAQRDAMQVFHAYRLAGWCGKLMHVTPAIDRIAELAGYAPQREIFRRHA